MPIAFFIPHRGCPHRCSFCDQRAISGEQESITPEKVREQLDEIFREGRPYDGEIAFFGGSFTCLAEEEMTGFLKAAHPFVQSGLVTGIRCSTRPDGISEDVLDLFSSYGGKAVELGVQSMDDAVLLKNGRGYSACDAKKAALLIRQKGLSLGVQMMTGLPGEGEDGAFATAKELLSLHPDTVRIYPALVLKNTVLAKWYAAGEYRPQSLEEAVACCAPIIRLFRRNGVRVIRVGLHAERSLEENLLAGPYHPAFGELCESRLFREETDELLKTKPKGSYMLAVSPKDRSVAAGQKRQNLLYWQERGYDIRITEDTDLKKGQRYLSQPPTERNGL
ncbi:MAG: radical SAM protein [Oscillospiraceae bacterium]|nr:radical SAM protein [Oscillospiraceae bacterium]